MSENSKILEGVEREKMILRLEGEESYYSYCRWEKIKLTAKGVLLQTDGKKDCTREMLIADAIFPQYFASLGVIGYPKKTIKKLQIFIEPEPESKWQTYFIWTNENDVFSPGYNKGDQWSCFISVSKEFFNKITNDYRSNRIEKLWIDISAATDRQECLWRQGPEVLEVDLRRGSSLFLRPDENEIKSKGYGSGIGYATCERIVYTEPSNFTEKIGRGDDDQDESDDEDDNQVELAEDKKQIKQDELTATLIAIKKYLRFAAICLFLIAVILIFK